jgi:ornithine cyclodeaminase
MCKSILGESISNIFIYDINEDVRYYDQIKNDKKCLIVDNWQKAYAKSDIFITCTVSKSRYINLAPKKGSLHLNVSLRDYKISVFDYFKDAIIVDDWYEICRENTDIELFHKEMNLNVDNVKTIVDVVCNNCLNNYSNEQPIMFNPMGMSVFDVSVADYFYQKALETGAGKIL